MNTTTNNLTPRPELVGYDTFSAPLCDYAQGEMKMTGPGTAGQAFVQRETLTLQVPSSLTKRKVYLSICFPPQIRIALQYTETTAETLLDEVLPMVLKMKLILKRDGQVIGQLPINFAVQYDTAAHRFGLYITYGVPFPYHGDSPLDTTLAMISPAPSTFGGQAADTESLLISPGVNPADYDNPDTGGQVVQGAFEFNADFDTAQFATDGWFWNVYWFNQPYRPGFDPQYYLKTTYPGQPTINIFAAIISAQFNPDDDFET